MKHITIRKNFFFSYSTLIIVIKQAKKFIRNTMFVKYKY